MYEDLEKIIDNELHRKLLKITKGKRVLFLENDFTMHNAVGNFYDWCKLTNTEHNCLFNIGKLPLQYILEQIDWFDIISFQTTWTYKISHVLEEEIKKLKSKKIVIECYTNEPSYYRKPKGIKHDLYTLNSYGDDMDNWELKKLTFK